MVRADVPEPDRFRSDAYRDVLDETQSMQFCRFETDALQRMKMIAEEGYPNEICGLLIGKSTRVGWEVSSVCQVENLNKERAADRFQLDPAGYQKVDSGLRGTDQEIIGVFHSHPDCPAKPSPTDLSNAWEGFVYPIVSVVAGQVAEVHCWTVTADVAEGGRFQKLPHQV